MAPPLVSLSGVSVRYAARPLFDGLDLALSAGDATCLVGRNGTGKSTLLALLAGDVEPDSGTRFRQPGVRLARVAQEPGFGDAADVAAYVAQGLAPMGGPDDYRVAAVLAEIGLDAAAVPDRLSGGEARRAALARALVGDPDVLLLDEPTNHLDLPGIEWLEGRLAAYRGALLVISHDRRFLATVTRRTWWLDRGRLRAAPCGFAGFEDWVAETLAAEAAARHKLDRRIAAETQWLREGLTARRRRNQGRVRALTAMRAERRDALAAPGTARLAVAEQQRSGTLVIEAAGIAKAYGERRLIDRFSTRIRRGDRVGVIGPNGAGKTTLVGLLIGRHPPDAGTVRLGTGLDIAYFDQRRETLAAGATVRRVLAPDGGDQIAVGGRARHIAGYLKDFLFDPGRIDAPADSLSGGERNRLLLARLFARPSNLLVLDEPTNDLDLETLDLLEDVLATYAGTVLLVSHDRDFLDRLVGSVIAVEGDGRVAETVGGYSDYLAACPAPLPAPVRSRGASGGAPSGDQPPPARPAAAAKPAKLSYKDQRALALLPTEIDRLTAAVAEAQAVLADPDLYRRDPARFADITAELDRLQAALAAAEDRWLDLAQRQEEIGG